MNIFDNSNINIPICFCGVIKDIEWGLNPYQQDIYGDDTPEWLCWDCHYAACMDI